MSKLRSLIVMKICLIFSFTLVLLLVGIFEIQESFAEQASGKPAWVVGSDKVCGDRLCSEIEEEELFVEKPIIPPLKQIKVGIPLMEVKCNEGKFTNITKSLIDIA